MKYEGSIMKQTLLANTMHISKILPKSGNSLVLPVERIIPFEYFVPFRKM